MQYADFKFDSLLRTATLVCCTSLVLRAIVVSRGTEDHTEALKGMLKDFAARKESACLGLEKIIPICEARADNPYKELYDQCRMVTEKAGGHCLLY